jgi:3D (Asp-Asp-Asp) domain-containing protein
MRIISRSLWSKALALVVAIFGFVLLHETQILDSQRVAEMLLGDESTPGPGSRLQFSATAYCKGTTTASGVRVRTGIAAADPSLLPVGSVLGVGTGDSKYDGVYTVMDTGPEVKGRELDLYIWSCHEALRFGRKAVRVSVLRLGWDPTASSPTIVDRLFKRREARRSTPRSVPAPVAPAEASAEASADAPGPESVPPTQNASVGVGF